MWSLVLTSALWVKSHTRTTQKKITPCPPKARINRKSTCSFITEEKVAGDAVNISRYVLCNELTEQTTSFGEFLGVMSSEEGGTVCQEHCRSQTSTEQNPSLQIRRALPEDKLFVMPTQTVKGCLLLPLHT